jgi:ketosteroid isomerase-like protein
VEVEELAERVYGAWNRGDLDEFTAYFAPDAVYETSGVFPGFAPEYRGPEGMRAFYETMHEAFDSFHIDILESEPSGQLTAARIRFRARGKTSGVAVDLEFAHGFKVVDDRVVFLVARESIDEVRERIAEL